MSNARKTCPFFEGKIDLDDGVGIRCYGHNDRYENEFERDAWCSKWCECEKHVECYSYDIIVAAGIGQTFSPD